MTAFDCYCFISVSSIIMAISFTLQSKAILLQRLCTYSPFSGSALVAMLEVGEDPLDHSGPTCDLLCPYGPFQLPGGWISAWSPLTWPC